MAAIVDAALLERVRDSIASAQVLIAEARQTSINSRLMREKARLNTELTWGCVLLSRVDKEYDFYRLYLYR